MCGSRKSPSPQQHNTSPVNSSLGCPLDKSESILIISTSVSHHQLFFRDFLFPWAFQVRDSWVMFVGAFHSFIMVYRIYLAVWLTWFLFFYHFSDLACSVAGITSDANVLTNQLRLIAQRYNKLYHIMFSFNMYCIFLHNAKCWLLL